LKTIKVNLANKSFNLSLQEDFAEHIESEIQHLFENDDMNDIKQLLSAYVKKSYDYYLLQKRIDALTAKIVLEN